MSDTLDRARFLDRLLSDALDAPEARRQELIGERCAGDRFLEAEALELLASATDDTSFLPDEAPLLDQVIGQLAAEIEPELDEGTELGRYRVEKLLGAGGMGRVYLAHRADGLYEQQVAIKVLRGSASADARRRFAREARILSRLDHPNIARLLDAGASDAGRGFLVMECVDGEPIDRHCQRLGLDLDQRLELLRQVTEAIAFAHRRLILHRDIKPANVLVTPNGQVKVLDFGIGLLLEEIQDPGTSVDDDSEMSTATERTAARPTRAFTPGFASPEQLTGDVIGAPSDVWQLGLLLRHLVLGLAGDVTQPPEPATQPLSQTLQAGVQKPVAPADLRRLKRGLDAIEARCLHADPEQRYGTGQALLDELEAEREGRPLRALQHRRRHLFSSFVRRHRHQLTIAAAAFATLVVTVIAYTVQLQRERDRTALALAEAEATNDLLADVLLAPEVVEQGPGVRVLDVMDEALVQARRLDHQPLVQGRVLHLVGRVKKSLSEAEEAVGIFEEARRAFQRASPEHGERALVVTTLAKSNALGTLGRIDEAEQTLESIADHPIVTSDPEQRAAWFEYVALMDNERGDLTEAIDKLAAAVELLTPLPETVAITRRLREIRNTLAVALQKQGRLDEALPLLRGRLDEAHAQHGDEHRSTIVSRHNLAALVAQLGRPAEAEQLFRRNRDVTARWLGTDHSFYLLSTTSLITAIAQQGRVEEAIELDEGILPVAEKIWGPEHRRTLFHRLNASQRLLLVGRTGEARSLLSGTVESLEKQLGPRSETTLNARMLRAQMLLDLGQPASARDDADAAYGHAIAGLGADAPIALGILQRRGLARVRAGDVERGLEDLRGAATGLERVLGPGADDALAARTALADGLGTAGGEHLPAAVALACSTRAEMQDILGPDHFSTVAVDRLARELGGCDQLPDA